MKISKRFIEKSFPVESISELCRHEKSIRQGHISTLQTWWARRPLAVCRASIFLASLPEASQIQNKKKVEALLKKIIPDMKNLEQGILEFTTLLSDFKNSNDEGILNTAKEIINLTNPNKTLVDSFSGGGSIPLEGIRLGFKTHASDLNPIASTALVLALDLAPGISKDGFKRLQEDIKEIENILIKYEAEDYPDQTILAYFWARTYKCPSCNFKNPLMQSKWLSKTRIRRSVLLKPNKKNGEIIFSVFEPKTKEEIDNADIGTVTGKSATCVFCHTETPTSEIQNQGLKIGLGETLYAKYFIDENGKDYAAINSEETPAVHLTKKLEDSASINFDLKLDLNGIRHLWAIQYGIKTIGDLFNPRQRNAIQEIANTIKQRRTFIKKTSASKKEELFRYLSLVIILNKVAVYSNRHSWWQSNGAFPANIFIRQAISMVWSYVEIPPASPGAGGWSSAGKWLIKVLQHLSTIDTPANIHCADAEKISLSSNTQDLVIIDPPYFDSITYAYLSDFFYPWMKALLDHDFPDWYKEKSTPKAQELIVDRKHKLAPSPKNSDFFKKKMASCLKEAKRVLTQDGLLVLMYGHKEISAWIALFSAISDSELEVTASWPIHTERSSKFKHSKVAALGTSCILTLRTRPKKSKSQPAPSFDDFKELSQKIVSDIKKKNPDLVNDPVALTMSVFPLLLNNFIKHEIIKKNGETLSAEELLEIAMD